MKVNELDTPSEGTYAKLVPSEETRQRIEDVINTINIENPASAKDLHVTIVYSRKACPEIEDIKVPLPIIAEGKAFGMFPNTGRIGSNCLVLKLDCPQMIELHQKCRNEYGATHDHPTYEPHITLSYDYPHDVVPNESLLEYFHGLVFRQYVVEPLNFDWNGS